MTDAYFWSITSAFIYFSYLFWVEEGIWSKIFPLKTQIVSALNIICSEHIFYWYIDVKTMIYVTY